LGIPLNSADLADSTPPAGDLANQVLSGTFSGVGPSLGVPIWGPMNVMLWCSINATLTTTSGNRSATVSSATGLLAGDSIKSPNLKPGTTIDSISGTDVTLSQGATATGADTTATFVGSGAGYAPAATVQLERTVDGGNTWIACGIGASGAVAKWVNIGPISFSFGEPEKGVGYRLNCLAYSSGTLNYRISTTGQAAVSISVPALA